MPHSAWAGGMGPFSAQSLWRDTISGPVCVRLRPLCVWHAAHSCLTEWLPPSRPQDFRNEALNAQRMAQLLAERCAQQ